MPIINPYEFYLIHLFSSLRIACFFIFFISVGFFIVFYSVKMDPSVEKMDKKHCKIIIPLSLAFVIISILGIVILPTKDAATAMLIAKYTTQENAYKTSEIVKYILEGLK